MRSIPRTKYHINLKNINKGRSYINSYFYDVKLYLKFIF